jgi:copper chaperone CopZ
MTTLTYSVPGISCGHCKNAIEAEVREVTGVDSAIVDIDARVVVVEGSAAEDAVRAAVIEAGYEVDSVS